MYFSMPFATTLSPHLEASRRNGVAWAHAMGMLRPQPGVPLSDIWDEDALVRFDFALCSAGLHPEATLEELDLSAQWLTWGTYGDDYYPAVFGRQRDLVSAKASTATAPRRPTSNGFASRDTSRPRRSWAARAIDSTARATARKS